MAEKSVPEAKGTVDLKVGDHIDEVTYGGITYHKCRVLRESVEMKKKYFVVQLDEKNQAKVSAESLKLD